MAKKTMMRAAVAAALLVAAPVLAQAQDVKADTVVATVNGTDITIANMVSLRESLPEQYLAMDDAVLFNAILQQLIQQTALADGVEGKLDLREQAGLENTRRAFMSGVALRGSIEGVVTDEALQAAYDKQFADFKGEQEFNASHILVATKEEAERLKADIDGGADFAEVARANSSDGAAANGGSLGWFGKGMMVKEFEDAVVAMKPGEVAGPIQTQFGWHLVKLNEARISSAPSLDDVRDALAQRLESEAVQKFIDDAVAAATVTRADEGIDPAVLKDQTLFDN